MRIFLVISLWILISFAFLLIYKFDGKESDLLKLLIVIFCFPWVIISFLREKLKINRLENKNV